MVGQDTQFKGTILAKGTIRIDGSFEGDVTTTSDIIIGETGQVKAQLKGRNATIAGVVSGNIEVAGKLELLSTAKLYGDIKAGMLTIGEGAIFKGACEMKQEGDISKKEQKPILAKS